MAETEVYLFTGPEAGEKNEAIENLRDAASKKNNGIEQYKYYAADVRIEDIVAQLQNASLFSKNIVVFGKQASMLALSVLLCSTALPKGEPLARS